MMRRAAWWGGVALAYSLAMAAATWPAAATMSTHLPSLGDPPVQLWTMRWYKQCLIEGRSPLRCEGLQYPAGAGLSQFSPLHFQSLLYLSLSTLGAGDVLCFNLIRAFGLVLTGLGTCALARRAVGDRASAALAGLLAMLSAPLLLHGMAHLEHVMVGWFALFLLAWLRLLEAPSPGRLVAAIGTYLLMVMSTPYFLVLAIVPAAAVVTWESARGGVRGIVPWWRARIGWLAGFAMVVGPCAIALFWPQLSEAARRAGGLDRPRAEFDLFGAPLWSYFVPTGVHRLGRLLPFDFFAETGKLGLLGEAGSYVGLVALILVHRAAVRRPAFARAGMWWALLGLLVVLSAGSSWTIGTARVDLPAAWLWEAFPPFRLIRVPSRFNLLAVVVVAVIAAAGLRDLLAAIRRPFARAMALGAIAVVATADLAIVPYYAERPPAMPAAYDRIRAADPRAAIAEVPQFGSNDGRYALRTYWQSLHGLKTTTGYSAIANPDFDGRVLAGSPFAFDRLADPGYLADGSPQVFDALQAEEPAGYLWLYLRSRGLDYVVVHHPATATMDTPVVETARLENLLAPSRWYVEPRATVYATDRLPPPTAPVACCDEGWRVGFDERIGRVVGRAATLAVYNDDADRPLVLAVEAKSLRRPRVVRLLDDGEELARWRVEPNGYGLFVSPPFHLPAGMRRLSLESDGEERPRTVVEAATGADGGDYSLRVRALCFRAAQPGDAEAARVAGGRSITAARR